MSVHLLSIAVPAVRPDVAVTVGATLLFLLMLVVKFKPRSAGKTVSTDRRTSVSYQVVSIKRSTFVASYIRHVNREALDTAPLILYVSKFFPCQCSVVDAMESCSDFISHTAVDASEFSGVVFSNSSQTMGQASPVSPLIPRPNSFGSYAANFFMRAH